jgi:serine kinase
MVCGYMPFDDSDIKKMIRDQIEGKLKYPSRFDHNKMSDVKELLNKMLEPDITRRYNIDKVLDHKWLRDMDYI